MAYEITRQLRTSISRLQGLEESDGFFVDACGRKNAALAAIQAAEITAKEAEIIRGLLGETPWPPMMLEELRTICQELIHGLRKINKSMSFKISPTSATTTQPHCGVLKTAFWKGSQVYWTSLVA